MISGEFTFCLNLDAASMDTYPNWCTVRVMDGVLLRLTSDGGNGQQWDVFGYGNANGTDLPSEFKLFATNANETQAARIVAHVVRTVGVRCNVNGYGAAWGNATVEESKLRWSAKAGRFYKLTAAPSIREGAPPRDKNVKARRWNCLSPADMRARLRIARHGR